MTSVYVHERGDFRTVTSMLLKQSIHIFAVLVDSVFQLHLEMTELLIKLNLFYWSTYIIDDVQVAPFL